MFTVSCGELTALESQIGDQCASEIHGRGGAAQVLRQVLSGSDHPAHGGANAFGFVIVVQIVEHHGGAENDCSGVGDALAGDVGSAAVHRFENPVVVADVSSRSQPQ